MTIDKSTEHLTPQKNLWPGIGLAAVVALVVLVLFVLPAEYGIDVTGVGRALGLTDLTTSTRTIEITDVTGGNETITQVEIPDTGDPVPLPNPAVYQNESAP